MRKIRVASRLLFLALCVSSIAQGMNILRPYDTLVRPIYVPDTNYQGFTLGEFGPTSKGYDERSQKVNVMQIWNAQQDSLAMLKGFSPVSAIGQKLVQMQSIGTEDALRGRFCVTGDLVMDYAGAIAGRWSCAKDLIFSIYLPFYAQHLTRVRWVDLTTNEEFKEELTNDIRCQVEELGHLHVGNWKRAGMGDMSFFVDWQSDYPQARAVLRNVRLNARLGLTIPTGLRADEDKLMAFPFGFDGSMAVPFGLGIDLMLAPCLMAGVDVQLTHTFGNTRSRRIKTHLDQTELLLLQKVRAHKDYGLIQRFNLYFGGYKFVQGLSGKIGYQFYKQGDSRLSLAAKSIHHGSTDTDPVDSTTYLSQEVANTAKSLEEWTSHYFVVNLDYDFGVHTNNCEQDHPRASLFTRVPFNGKRVAEYLTLGFGLSIDF